MKTTKTKQMANSNTFQSIAIIASILMILVAVFGITAAPKAFFKEDVAEQTYFEEQDAFTVNKMEMTTYTKGGKECNNYYISMANAHVVFLAEIDLEQYLYYDIGDNIPGTLIVDGDAMNFELDEFGKSFVVVGYIGLSDEN